MVNLAEGGVIKGKKSSIAFLLTVLLVAVTGCSIEYGQAQYLRLSVGTKMRCNNPKWLDFHGFMAPCGKCLACKKTKAREWAARIIHEAYYYEASSFVTLTYNDKNLPGDRSLDPDHLSLFLKRLRKKISPQKIKYFACGEYGGKGRPHYHLILFGIHPNQIDLIAGAWGLGLVHLGTVTPESAFYITSYILKDQNDVGSPFPGPSGSARGPEKGGGGGKQPFRRSSQGLGARWAKDNRELLEQNLAMTMQGTPQGIPRYYVKALDLDTEALAAKNQEANDAVNKWLAQRALGHDHVKKSFLQSEENIRRMQQIYLEKKQKNL